MRVTAASASVTVEDVSGDAMPSYDADGCWLNADVLPQQGVSQPNVDRQPRQGASAASDRHMAARD